MRICLFGGPGSGKSTTSSRLFSSIKEKRYSIELVQEYVKQWAYKGLSPVSFDQVYLFAKQIKLEDTLIEGGARNIITDSPLYLSCYYAYNANLDYWEDLKEIAKKFDKKNRSINLLLDRKNIEYSSEGRYEKTKNEAVEKDLEIEAFLKKIDVAYTKVETLDYNFILKQVESVLE